MCTTDVQSVAEVRRFPHIYFDGMNTRHKLANIILQKNPKSKKRFETDVFSFKL